MNFFTIVHASFVAQEQFFFVWDRSFAEVHCLRLSAVISATALICSNMSLRVIFDDRRKKKMKSLTVKNIYSGTRATWVMSCDNRGCNAVWAMVLDEVGSNGST